MAHASATTEENKNYEQAKQMDFFDGTSSFDYNTNDDLPNCLLGKRSSYVETSGYKLGFSERRSATDDAFFCDTLSMSQPIRWRCDNENGIMAVQLLNHSAISGHPPPQQIDSFEVQSAAKRAGTVTSEAASGLVDGASEGMSDSQMNSYVQISPPLKNSWKSEIISMRIHDSAPACQMPARTTMPTTLADVHKTVRTSQMGSQRIMKGPQMGDNETIGTRELITASRTNPTCHCCCQLSQCSQTHFPAFGLKNQRPSVIMIPVKCIAFGETRKDDSSSSEEDGGEEQTQTYFRKNINGTTAKFQLSKEDWKRIPINTFPSGGRLLSGDWTRIFVSKVKESNPWCSLRFKNNHVRSENSRKIHSAVFFRGGAECKRPECNVKARFVIRKEKGKYVEVTYDGNVCHSRSADRK